MSRYFLVSLLWVLMCFHNMGWSAESVRYALVIGNDAYKIGQLKNAVNDASDFAEKLDRLEFDVTLLVNAGSEEMKNVVSTFYQKIKQDQTTSVFYYAGHAMQLNNVNYLLPINVDVSSEHKILSSSLSLNDLLISMRQAKSRSNIVILDACRNNPFGMSDDFSQGLAPVEAPPGTFIAYSTEPGQVASDGNGRNGTYTKHLLKHVNTAVDIETMFKQVRKGVMDETHHKQIPWEHSSLYSSFLFKQNDADAMPVIPSF